MIKRLVTPQQILLALSCVTVNLSLWGSPSLAGDPFRTDNPRDIGDQTEAAFEALFRDGNYEQAKSYLTEAEATEADEPLVYAMRASIGYIEDDLETLKTYADKTLNSAEKLNSQDPLRGNLYMAVGNFLEGTYNFKKKEDTLGAISKLQKVFQYLDAAQSRAANDPELNLVKGYLDLVLAVNLPFSSPEQAISRFNDNAAPDYLVNRGIAVAYRDLKQYDRALEFVERAMQSSPDNPELAYFKGHLLRHQSKIAENEQERLALLKQAIAYFESALAKAEQLPESVLKPIEREQRKSLETIQELTSNASVK